MDSCVLRIFYLGICIILLFGDILGWFGVLFLDYRIGNGEERFGEVSERVEGKMWGYREAGDWEEVGGGEEV